MIYYKFKKEPYNIEVKGHANFAESGKDIVCASVSTATILSANLIKKLNQHKNVKIEIRDGFFHLKVKTQTYEIKAVCENLIWTFQELEKSYPKYIKNQEER